MNYIGDVRYTFHVIKINLELWYNPETKKIEIC